MEEFGDISFNDANDANIPVDIWFQPLEEHPEVWELKAGNYMPRKAHVEEAAFRAVGSKEELTGLIKKHILPLYETALSQIKHMADGNEGSLYYWLKD